ncbi:MULTISPECIES: hypothetical protein [unclassified Streptosporangium]|uniref:hypothetical protein n=1 Tax=unclassified Streptosporangium TaxID=2632669 RepID=UPI003FA35D09
MLPVYQPMVAQAGQVPAGADREARAVEMGRDPLPGLRRGPAAGLGMVGTPHPALIGAARTTSLIAVLPEGGAEAIASREKSPDHDELLDHAAMEFGTD